MSKMLELLEDFFLEIGYYPNSTFSKRTITSWISNNIHWQLIGRTTRYEAIEKILLFCKRQNEQSLLFKIDVEKVLEEFPFSTIEKGNLFKQKYEDELKKIKKGK